MARSVERDIVMLDSRAWILERADSLLRLKSGIGVNAPSSSFSDQDVLRLRALLIEVAALPGLRRRDAKTPHRGESEYQGVVVLDPNRVRSSYTFADDLPDPEECLFVRDGVLILTRGGTDEHFVRDVDRRIEKELLEMLFRVGQRPYYDQLLGPKPI